MCSTFVYFCVKHKNYLRQDFSYIDLLQQLSFFKRNRNVVAEAAKIQNSYDVLQSLRDHAFSYKKTVYKKLRFKHNLVSRQPLYNAIINFKQNFVNLTAS